jgi:hypothetical protein
MSILPLTSRATVGQISFGDYEKLAAVVTLASKLPLGESMALQTYVHFSLSWAIPTTRAVKEISEILGSANEDDLDVVGICSGKGLVEVSHCCGI